MMIKRILDENEFLVLSDELVSLCASSFHEEAPWTKQQFIADFNSKFSVYYVAIENKVIVGFLCGQLIFEEFELFLIAVREDVKKKGVGTMLFHALEDYLKERQATTILLEVRESNVPARIFYKKQAFECYHVRNDYYQNPVENGFMLRKEVRSSIE